MMKPKHRKHPNHQLQVATETLRRLSDASVETVRGGVVAPSTTCSSYITVFISHCGCSNR